MNTLFSTLAIIKNALLFSTPLKGWLGCVALGGEALAKNTASHLH